MEKSREAPVVSDEEVRDLQRQIYQPLETYRVGRNEFQQPPAAGAIGNVPPAEFEDTYHQSTGQLPMAA